MPYNRFDNDPKEPSKASSGMGAYIQAEKLMQIAFVLPAAVVIGWIGGWWLSNHFHQKWMELAGIFFGCMVGLVYVVQTAVAVEKETRMRNGNGNGPGKGTGSDES
jgi:uncharacterized membrane protein YfcA